MNASFLQVLLSLVAGIAVIILCTTRWKLPAFFAILLACFATGIGMQLSLPAIISTSKSGFGHILEALGFIIVLGTALGMILEHTGCTKVMAAYILKKTGEKNAALAIGLTGFIVGLPVFCDSGYIVLSGLNKSMIKRSGVAAVTMSLSLASGLYAVHCLLPPHPGAAAAASTLGVDYGQLIGYGLLVAFPVMLVGYGWSRYIGKKYTIPAEDTPEINTSADLNAPSVMHSFLPVIVPIILIATRSLLISNPGFNQGWQQNLLALGDPVPALAIAILLALSTKKRWTRAAISSLLHDGIEKAGSILLIIGAGGAFGAILTAGKLGDHFASLPFLAGMGILFPFLLTVVLKTAQGSSTVAIITAASIVLPLLPGIGLDSEKGRLFTVLAMGAGSMMISHANDAYFWVIAKFSGIDMKTMLRTYTVASVIMGVSAFIITWILSLFFL